MTGRPPLMAVARAVWMAAAFVVSWLSSDLIFLRAPTGADECSYVFQAWNLRDGVVARDPPPLEKQFDQEMIILDRNRGWLSRYPPGHPLWLVPGTFHPDGIRIMVALAAALGMGFACAAASTLRIPQAFVALPLLLSPFFVFMYGTHLSHTSGFMTCAALLWAYIRWRTTSLARYAAIAGLAWAFFFLNRTYTALLVALPLALDCLVAWLRDRRWRAFGATVLFAGCASTGIAAYLLYNRLATGDWFTATYLFYEPSEGLGFGPRRTQGVEILHTPAVGFAVLRDNVSHLNSWLFGFPGSLFAFAALAAAGASRRWTALWLAIPACVALGYVAFWYPGVREAGGPVYYFDVLPFLIVAAAAGLAACWTRLGARRSIRAAVFAIALLATAASSASMIAREGAARAAAQKPRRDLFDLYASAPPNAMILVEKVDTVHFGEIIANPRGLLSDPLLVRGMGPQYNPVALRVFPDRKAFLLRGTEPLRLEPMEPSDRLTMTYGAHKMLYGTGRNVAAPDHPIGVLRVAEQGRDGKGWLASGKFMYLPAGRFKIAFEGSCDGVPADRPLEIDVTTHRGRIVLAETQVTGSRTGTIATLTLDLHASSTRIEPRVRYKGGGRVTFEQLAFAELPDHEPSVPAEASAH